jgi:malate dehydrogenase
VCSNGGFEIVQGLSVNDFSRAKMDATLRELEEERDAVRSLL